MPVKMSMALLALALSMIARPVAALAAAAPDSNMGPAQFVEIATEVNPQVRAARARWYSAMHQVEQNYAPADPLFGYANIDSPTNGFSEASVHTLTATESFQFPGKAMLQARNARGTAAIARLAYEATVRNVRAQTETAYYQIVLDGSLAQVQADTVDQLQRMLKVTEIAYSANRVTQTDFISAEFDLAAAKQTEQQSHTAELNDETALNQLLFRPPGSPLQLDRRVEFTPLAVPLDRLVDMAAHMRQEILEAALAQHNSETAMKLARLEYAPDYTVGFVFDNYLLASGAPSVNRLQDYGFTLAFNVPVFFWLHQNEDIKRAGYDLDAARSDLDAVRSQTAATVTTFYRNARLADRTAILYRDTLIPLARQDFEVGLTAYESGKIDFVTLSGILQRTYNARVAYLQAANQYLANRIALEQAIGAPLPQ